jgi:hypothetical protein
LFPNVDTLEKHRAVKHKSNVPQVQLQTQRSAGETGEAAAIVSSTSETSPEASATKSNPNPDNINGYGSALQQYDHITWFFSPEEEARRRAFLPLQ